MNTAHTRNLLALTPLCALHFTTTVAKPADPLPSWNNGAAKTSIVKFVDKVTKQSSPDYVAPAERIAVFDNDGTLWAERTPFIVRWPNRIPAGRVSNEMVHEVDTYTTLARIAGASVPAGSSDRRYGPQISFWVSQTSRTAKASLSSWPIDWKG